MTLNTTDFIKEIAKNPATKYTCVAKLSIWNKGNNKYEVKSYDNTIAKYENGNWYVTTKEYSVTTSKHTTYLKRLLPNVIEEEF